VCFVSAAIVAGGCSQKSEAPPSPTIPVETARINSEDKSETPLPTNELALATTEESPSPQEEALHEAEQQAEPAFQPPYPHRTNPFQQPNVEQLVRSGLRESTGGVLQLKGFSNNNGQPRVLLAMDEQLAPLAEGEEWFGVRIIEIAPPQVILQRGRIRWTESLFERRYETTDAVPTNTKADSPKDLDTKANS